MGESQSLLANPVSLTSTDGREVSHVMEELADNRTGPGVQPMAVDPQVELDPAGLWSELQRRIPGGEVELFFVYLVPSGRARRVIWLLNWWNENAKTPGSTWSGHPIVLF